MLLTSNSHGGSTTNLGKESGELHHPVLYIRYEQSFQRMMDLISLSKQSSFHNLFQKLWTLYIIRLIQNKHLVYFWQFSFVSPIPWPANPLIRFHSFCIFYLKVSISAKCFPSNFTLILNALNTESLKSSQKIIQIWVEKLIDNITVMNNNQC